jgi:hypothetical protein
MDLMYLLCNYPYRFANARFAGRDFCNKSIRTQCVDTRIRGTLRCSNFRGNYRQAMLYCL